MSSEGGGHFDFLVLGGGSAGYAAARTARQWTEKVAIVDGSKTLGGLCILRGCMPSKTLLYAAEVLHLASQGKTFGLNTGRPFPDLPAVQARKRRIIESFASHRRGQLQDDRFTLFRSHGRFTGPNEVTLADGTVLTAGKILVATGSTIATPPVPGLAETPFITSDDVLDLETLPPSMLVLGGGIVACELAQYLARMGSRITLVQRSPHLLSGHSPAAAAVVEETFREGGIETFTDTHILGIDSTDEGVSVRFRQGQRLVVREAVTLFNALGRNPATADLGLEEAGVKTLGSGHIGTDRNQATSNPDVYAAGDCAGPHEIVHVAIQQGEIAAAHAFGKPAKPFDAAKLVTVVFTDPQVASAGLDHRDLAGRDDVVRAEFPFSDHGKSILMEARRGYVSVTAEKGTGRVLRAECVGKDAGELIHALSVGIGLGATVDDLLGAQWYHPTLSEIWTYPLEDLAEALA